METKFTVNCSEWRMLHQDTPHFKCSHPQNNCKNYNAVFLKNWCMLRRDANMCQSQHCDMFSLNMFRENLSLSWQWQLDGFPANEGAYLELSVTENTTSVNADRADELVSFVDVLTATFIYSSTGSFWWKVSSSYPANIFTRKNQMCDKWHNLPNLTFVVVLQCHCLKSKQI